MSLYEIIAGALEKLSWKRIWFWIFFFPRKGDWKFKFFFY